MPFGQNIQDGVDSQGNPSWGMIANGVDGPSADMRYAISHNLRAAASRSERFFLPLWGFVAGPFGPQFVFMKATLPGQANLSP